MRLADLIAPDRVIVAIRPSDKAQLLGELARRASRLLQGIDPQSILSALEARERLGSTGCGQGIAVPHARIGGLPKMFGFFARLERPIDFDAIDGRPVDLVFLLLVPERAGNEHLAALAAVARQLRNPDVAARLRAGGSRDETYDALTATENS